MMPHARPEKFYRDWIAAMDAQHERLAALVIHMEGMLDKDKDAIVTLQKEWFK